MLTKCLINETVIENLSLCCYQISKRHFSFSPHALSKVVLCAKIW